MQILVVEPKKKPVLTEIDGSLKSMQNIVGGLIQPIYPFDDPSIALVCNDEGLLLELPVNRGLWDSDGKLYSVICGTFFLCSAPEDLSCFTSLTPKQMKWCQKRFHTPEMFLGMDGQIICLPLDTDQ